MSEVPLYTSRGITLWQCRHQNNHRALSLSLRTYRVPSGTSREIPLHVFLPTRPPCMHPRRGCVADTLFIAVSQTLSSLIPNSTRTL